MQSLLLVYNANDLPEDVIFKVKNQLVEVCQKRNVNFKEYRNISTEKKIGTLYWLYKTSASNKEIEVSKFLDYLKMTNFYETEFVDNFGVTSVKYSLREKYLVFLTPLQLREDSKNILWKIVEEYAKSNERGKIGILTVPEYKSEKDLSMLIESFISDLFSKD